MSSCRMDQGLYFLDVGRNCGSFPTPTDQVRRSYGICGFFYLTGIKAFYGTSENAVKSQIWIALSVYVLVAIVKKRLQLEQSLYTILQILSLTCFEKAPLNQVLTEHSCEEMQIESRNQLRLFDI